MLVVLGPQRTLEPLVGSVRLNVLFRSTYVLLLHLDDVLLVVIKAKLAEVTRGTRGKST